MTGPQVVVRRARTPDVRAIRDIVAPMATSGRIVAKDAVQYYETVHEFQVVELDGEVVGCGALHVMWEDLAEVRTIAVLPAYKGRGLGSAVLEKLLADARHLGVSRVFCLTFETAFSRSTARRSNPRCMPSCSGPTTRAWPSSSISSASNPTPWATRGCC